jgi:hypothetical protein
MKSRSAYISKPLLVASIHMALQKIITYNLGKNHIVYQLSNDLCVRFFLSLARSKLSLLLFWLRLSRCDSCSEFSFDF